MLTSISISTSINNVSKNYYAPHWNKAQDIGPHGVYIPPIQPRITTINDTTSMTHNGPSPSKTTYKINHTHSINKHSHTAYNSSQNYIPYTFKSSSTKTKMPKSLTSSSKLLYWVKPPTDKTKHSTQLSIQKGILKRYSLFL